MKKQNRETVVLKCGFQRKEKISMADDDIKNIERRKSTTKIDRQVVVDTWMERKRWRKRECERVRVRVRERQNE